MKLPIVASKEPARHSPRDLPLRSAATSLFSATIKTLERSSYKTYYGTRASNLQLTLGDGLGHGVYRRLLDRKGNVKVNINGYVQSYVNSHTGQRRPAATEVASAA